MNYDCFSQKNSVDFNQKTDSSDINYFFAGISFGNQVLNNNKFLNSRQNNTAFYYTPEIGYVHKSGLGFTANSLMFLSQSKLSIGQFSFTPSYDIFDKNYWDIHLSYSYYLINDHYNPNLSPIQHEIDISFINRKHFIQPGFEAGYSFGTSGQVNYKDSLLGSVLNRYYDSTLINTKIFFTALSIEHRYTVNHLFSKNDNIEIIPCLTLYMGKENESYTHNSNLSTNGFYGVKYGRLKNSNSKFRPESLNFSLGSYYNIGNFNIAPQINFDFDLTKSKNRGVSTLFDLSIEYSF